MQPAAEAQLQIGDAERLLRAQHPDLAGQPLRPAGEGWDNVVFRLGDQLAVKFPRTSAVAEHLELEWRWLAQVSSGLPIKAPLTIRRGRPDPRYPFPWSVVRWVPGTAVWDLSESEIDGLAGSDACAATLAELLTGLGGVAPSEVPSNPYRGCTLRERRQRTDDHFTAAKRVLPNPVGWSWAELTDMWHLALETRPAKRRRWCHGDIHPGNVIASGGAYTGLVDWVDLGAGDPAVDLAAAWSLCDADRRRIVAERTEFSERRWQRAQGWAIAFGLAYLVGSRPETPLRATGIRLLRSVSAS